MRRLGTASLTPALMLIVLLASGPGCLYTPPDELAVWSEFLAYDQVQGQLETLAAHSAALYLRVRPEDLGGPLWELLASAQAQNVEVRLWLQLPAEGTWLNERNMAAGGELARTLLAQAQANGFTIEWLIFDLEPEFAYAQALHDTAVRGAAGDLLEFLRRHQDRAQFETAAAALAALVEELHTRNIRVMVATLPWIIDDLGDGDADFQDIFDTPFVHVPWDQVCVMAYRPVFAELFGLSLSPEYVASYARSVRLLFGPTAQVALGNIGTPGLFTPSGYTTPADIGADIAAARSAGVRSVSLFSLDGMMEQGGALRWLAAAGTPAWWRPVADPAVTALRTALRWLDRLAGPFFSDAAAEAAQR
jgi:hypothetical protein